jgi:hypothetical protein
VSSVGSLSRCDAGFFRNVDLVNLTTAVGDLDVGFIPAGTAAYADLSVHVVEYDLDGLTVPVAAVADIIRSREAADRPKDLAACRRSVRCWVVCRDRRPDRPRPSLLYMGGYAVADPAGRVELEQGGTDEMRIAQLSSAIRMFSCPRR